LRAVNAWVTKRISVKKLKHVLSVAEAAQVLQCDEAYIELMMKRDQLLHGRREDGSPFIHIESVINTRQECWREIKRIVLQVVQIMEDESLGLLMDEMSSLETLKNAGTSKRSRKPRRPRVSSAMAADRD
jgi:hypothetical protein